MCISRVQAFVWNGPLLTEYECLRLDCVFTDVLAISG